MACLAEITGIVGAARLPPSSFFLGRQSFRWEPSFLLPSPGWGLTPVRWLLGWLVGWGVSGSPWLVVWIGTEI